MKLVPVALMYLGSFAFLGADTAPLDVASEFRKRWNQWALSRGKRELRALSSISTGLADPKDGWVQTLIQPLDVRGASGNPQASDPGAAHPRVKRHQRGTNLQRPRALGCRLGTCTTQNLLYQIHQYWNSGMNTAPPDKISPKGYGRRRRRALLEADQARTRLSAESLVNQVPTSPAH